MWDEVVVTEIPEQYSNLPIIEAMVKQYADAESMFVVKVSAAIIDRKLLIVFAPGYLQHSTYLYNGLSSLLNGEENVKLQNELWEKMRAEGGASIKNIITSPEIDNYSFSIGSGLIPEILDVVRKEIRTRVAKYQKELNSTQ